MSRGRFLVLILASLVATSLISGCGFKLRGPQPLPFETIHVGADPNTEFGAAVRRRIATSGTTVAIEDAAAADARVEILRNRRTQDILSLSSAGKVSEFQLNQALTFRVIDRAGTALIPATTISARRDYTFDDSQVIAKEQEEALLWRDMENDLLQQLMRRLAAIGP
ncbi:LPS assembly lipoprotein LptE [Rhodocyclaceae bacterium SMB388]